MMVTKIIEVYYKLVKAGNRTINQVPYNLKDEVQTLIDADNSALQQANREDLAQ